MSDNCKVKDISDNNTLQQSENDCIKFLLNLLTNLTPPENLLNNPDFNNNADFKKLCNHITALRDLSSALAKGNLKTDINEKGYIFSNLKTLQSNLQHLTWQSKMIANGDFSQRVDFLGEFSDAFNEMIYRLQHSNSQLLKMATTDALTKIPNRRALIQFLTEAFKKSVQEEIPFNIIIFDLDFFKCVNDTYGHIVGDKVLVKVSDILNSHFRSNDIFSRYGGEEFMAALLGTNLENSLKITQRAIDLVKKTEINVNDKIIFVTVSAGISSRIPEDKSYEDIIKRSDMALYEAKSSGRNRFCIV